jgi:hypothetical protein
MNQVTMAAKHPPTNHGGKVSAKKQASTLSVALKLRIDIEILPKSKGIEATYGDLYHLPVYY